ncbi:MAG: hypothetical protein ABL963_02730 [Longimicrobiales bacterium]
MAQLDQDLFRRMQEAAQRFRSGESDFEEIMTPNGPAHLVRDPTNALGFRIDFMPGASRHSVSLQEYPASPRRPHGYPAPLPFLAGYRATIDTLDQAVTWHGVGDHVSAVAEITRQCLEDEWVRTTQSADDDASVEPLGFEKDDVHRLLTVVLDDGPTRVTLRETRPRSGA